MAQVGKNFLKTQVENAIKHVCDSNNNYGLEIFSEEGERIYFVTQDLDFPGKLEDFCMSINLYPEENTLHFTLPLYSEGLVGDSIGLFYQTISEINASMNGNAKIVPYHYDDSNRPCLMLACELDKVDEVALRTYFEYLTQVFICTVPLLNMTITQLNLSFHPQARLQGPNKNLLDGIQLALRPSEP